jgi:single-strand DNA-binding protein
MINKVTLIGNLGRDPEIRHLEGGIAVVKFSLATNESYRDKSTGEWKTDTEWHDSVAWRQLAERVAKDLHKGSLVFVEGKLTHRKWQDKETKQDRYSTEIVANTIRSLERREGSGGARSYGENLPSADDAPVSRTEYTPREMSGPENDDLPF